MKRMSGSENVMKSDTRSILSKISSKGLWNYEHDRVQLGYQFEKTAEEIIA